MIHCLNLNLMSRLRLCFGCSRERTQLNISIVRATTFTGGLYAHQLNIPDNTSCDFYSSHILAFRAVGRCWLACFLAYCRDVSSNVSMSGVGQLRQLVCGGAARHRAQLLLQNVCTLGGSGDSHLPAFNKKTQMLQNLKQNPEEPQITHGFR